MWRKRLYDEKTGVRCMVTLPVVLIVMKMEQRAADINAGGSFHGYSYTITTTKSQVSGTQMEPRKEPIDILL